MHLTKIALLNAIKDLPDDAPLVIGGELLTGVEIIRGRINAEGGNAAAALGEVGLKGTQNTQVFLALAGAHEMLADSIAMGAEAWATPTALLDEYAQRANTTAFKTEVAWNTIKDAAITAGSATLPVIAGLADGTATLVASFASLPQPVQATVGGLAALGGAGLVAVGGTLKLVSTVADLKGDLKTLGVDLSGLSHLDAFRQRMLADAAVQKVLEAEGLA